MNFETLKKLRRHIERTGIYEPIAVREHPREPGKFEVINGHNRLRVLTTLGYQDVDCTIWNIDDDQCRLFLATLDRLSGGVIPERRALLMGKLVAAFGAEELTDFVLEDLNQLRELDQIVRLEPSRDAKSEPGEIEHIELPVMASFMLEDTESEVIDLAINFVLNKEKVPQSRGHALGFLAQYYLTHLDSGLNETKYRDWTHS